MARLVYGLMQSLDGYVAGPEGGPGLPMPSDALHRHFSDQLDRSAGSLYGRRMYELMRYWDSDEATADDVGRAYALAWRAKPKWVVSTTLHSVGPNATLVSEHVETFVRNLKSAVGGDIEVAGPTLAARLTSLGLIDEYRLYIAPVVLGAGKPFFAAPTPPLRLTNSEQLDGDTILLTYRPA